MSFIETIEIKNFKSIRHQKIVGCKRVNVFIGYPNVGKSNILEALSLFSIDKEDLFFLDFVRLENLTTLFFNGNVEENSEVRINEVNRVITRAQKNSLDISIQFDRHKYGFDNIDGDHNKFERREADIFGSFNIIEANKKVNNFRGRNGIKLENGENVALLKYEYKKYTVHSGKDYWSLSHPFGENLFSILFNKPQLYKEVQDLFSFYDLELLFDFREQKLAILKRIKNGIFSIPYDLVADTLQRIIFYKASILSNKESVLLFEEPEAHMFPPYISKFTSDIVHDENKNQFFITTHSPFVLNDLMDNLKGDELSIYIVSYKKETGETLIHKMNDDETHEAYQFGYDFFMNMDKFITQNQHG